MAETRLLENQCLTQIAAYQYIHYKNIIKTINNHSLAFREINTITQYSVFKQQN